ncbi:MAG: hypothetical protein ACOVJ8_04260 [Sediminibacterium sp.]|jgi:hypothetical protein
MRILYCIIIIGVLFFGCKKYPEDDKLSFRTPLHRLSAHSWKLDKLFIDGIDSSAREYYYNPYFPAEKFIYKGLILTLSDKRREKNSINYIASQNQGGLDSWRFVNKSKENIIFGGGGSDYLNLYRVDSKVSWKINKLTKNELNIITTSNGRIHEVNFVKE